MRRFMVWLGAVLLLFLPLPLGALEVPFKVAASIPPLCNLVKQVGGERVEVVQLVPNGFNPHVYEPTPRDIQQMLEARAVFLVGLGIDSVLERVLRGVDAEKTIFWLNEGIEVLQDENGYPDPHIWMSLRNAQIIVENIARSLSTIDPQGSSFYQSRARAYQSELQTLDVWFAKEIVRVENRGFIASHNAWSYLARDYGLHLKGVIERAPEREPTPQELQELIKAMKSENIRVVFAEPQFNQKIAQVLAQETGSTILMLDPLGRFPELPYTELMRQNLTQILKGFTTHAQNQSS
ncbi:MAG: metal ABC transporter substrate-binding protein [Candidatus Caldatribacteriaceae bacterium]